MKIKGFFKDLLGSSRAVKRRKAAISEANGKEIEEDRIGKIARALHPGKIKATVTSISKETSDSVRIRLSSKDIPLFKAGTYLTIELEIKDSFVTRAYSIVTSPKVAYENKYVELIVKDYKDGFVSSYLNHDLKENSEVTIEVGLGFFYYDEFRDQKNIVAIAGGAGITPFISLAHDIKERNLPLNLSILYGSDNPNEIIAKKELDELKCDNIKVIDVISGNYPSYKGEKGFINRHIIKKYSPESATYFICGPIKMYELVKEELSSLGVDIRRVRHESFAINDASKLKDFPKDLIDKEFIIEVHQGLQVRRIKALAQESIATALERNGIKIHTSCR